MIAKWLFTLSYLSGGVRNTLVSKLKTNQSSLKIQQNQKEIHSFAMVVKYHLCK